MSQFPNDLAVRRPRVQRHRNNANALRLGAQGFAGSVSKGEAVRATGR
jgi:hypothetical protein